MKKKFKFTIWYFKPNGKFYTEEEVEWEIRTLELMPDSPYMPDVVAKLRGLRDNGGQGALPGLESGTWNGPILVNCKQGFPCLIQPQEVMDAVRNQSAV